MTNTTSVSSPGVSARIVCARFALVVVLGGLSMLLLSGRAVYAQQPGTGVRAGVSSGPDQFYFGAHFDTGPIYDRLSFRPNAEVGIGDNRTLVTGNFEFVYWWPLRRHPWSIYAGGGPGVVFTKINEEHGGQSSTNPGFNILFGAAHRRGLFVELKFGLMEHSPDVKFGVGYTWR